jgi:hypothetical protein
VVLTLRPAVAGTALVANLSRGARLGSLLTEEGGPTGRAAWLQPITNLRGEFYVVHQETCSDSG